MSYLFTAIVLGVLIFVHELGHLLAAKAVGIPVERFSLGFGPVIWARRYRGVEYCVSLIPLGGYVLPQIADEAAFLAIPIRKRIIFSLGGPVANWLSAVVLIGIVQWISTGFTPYGVFIAPWAKTVQLTGQFLATLPTIFSHPDQLSGIVGIVAAGKSVMSDGVASSLRFAVLLNLNLAVFNMLPIAPLDGGKILCALLEKVHPRLARLHTGFAVVGLMLLLLLMVYTTVLDVVRQMA
jgi:regulator of sigma E protease